MTDRLSPPAEASATATSQGELETVSSAQCLSSPWPSFPPCLQSPTRAPQQVPGGLPWGTEQGGGVDSETVGDTPPATPSHRGPRSTLGWPYDLMWPCHCLSLLWSQGRGPPGLRWLSSILFTIQTAPTFPDPPKPGQVSRLMCLPTGADTLRLAIILGM